MAFELIEHTADMGIRSVGATLEEAFSDGALAMFFIMTDPEKIIELETFEIEVSADYIDLLFIEFLNEILFKMDVEEMLFKKASNVRIEEDEGHYILKASLNGEKLDKEKHDLKIEVKAATYAGLKYRQENGKHILECVVDI